MALQQLFNDNKKIVDSAKNNRHNECKESKGCIEWRLCYGTCKGYIKRADYNTNIKCLVDNLVDKQVKLPDENPSIGIIICKSKDKTFVEYALKQSNVPIGVATYHKFKISFFLLTNSFAESMIVFNDNFI